MACAGIDYLSIAGRVEEFKADFAEAMASKWLGWEAKRMRVVSVSPGSVVVAAELWYDPLAENTAFQGFQVELDRNASAVLGPPFFIK